jgi:hypothetical protein
MQYSFGAGLLAFTPSGSNPTPVWCGVLQDVSLKVTSAQKELFGQNRGAVAVADAELSIGGTAKFAQLSGSLIKQAINGSIATGQILPVLMEAGTIPGSPYQVTVTNSATWSADLGVYDYTVSKFLTRVASAPATGQYSVAAGVYTFAAADTTHAVGINYSYTATTGFTVSLTNQLMGAANTFTALLLNSYGSQSSGFKLWAVSIAGIDFALKNTDFTMQDLPFKAYADSSNRLIDVYTAE